MCTLRALALCALSFQSRERMADVAVPCALDRRPPAGAACSCDRSQPRTCLYSYERSISPPARME
eukprot:75039-Pleurochrysis_carterae.AAC.1